MACGEKKNEYSASVEADRNLLAFDTYEEYLDSLIDIVDLRNLRSIHTARLIAYFGYRSTGITLSEAEFYARRKVIASIVFPKLKPLTLYSTGLEVTEPFAKALADREYANRTGQLNSIIFIRNDNKNGYEISGYIDYAHRLMTYNWRPFFMGKRQILPTDSDLAYYNWRNGSIRVNLSRNYEAILDSVHGFVFHNRHDHKMILPNPEKDPGQNTTKTRIYSEKYTQIEIYDHEVKKKS